MNKASFKYVYGPVFSRRLGHSLGIDLVPFKTCTYDCVYCQLGRTTHKTTERKEYVPVVDVIIEVEKKLSAGPAPDYISLVGSGEPTLHARIGELIAGIKRITSIPLAVITNGSLLWKFEVQDALMAADVTLPSLDAGDEELFEYVNRPCPEIGFGRMVDGLAEFKLRYPGQLWLEVFLLGGVTGIPSEVEKIAALARFIRPNRIQVATISRPPAEDFAVPVETHRLERLKELLSGEVEVISANEPAASVAIVQTETSDAEILSMLGRHPSTIEGIASEFGLNAVEAVKRLQMLGRKGAVKSVTLNGAIFYETVRAG